jgi:hypothetical protein
VDVVTFVA